MTWIDIALLVYVGGGTWYLERELKPGAPANLDPQETLAVNETRRDVGFQSGDFAEEPERERATEAPSMESTVGGSGPGFTAIAALAALLAGTIALARRRL